CHADPAIYQKKKKGAGWPADGVDLLAAARSVGIPRRGNCGMCHFNGGGGNAVKHGDLDTTLTEPTERVDVHMGRYGMLCVDCHRTKNHDIAGRSITVTPVDDNPVACTDCHDGKPHRDSRLNRHTERVSCQACHIPVVAKDLGTKVDWDWSQAGQDLDIKDPHTYLKIKGRFVWKKNLVPQYFWFNGNANRYLLGDKIDPAKVTHINFPQGSREDPRAKVFPFKVHTGKQPYDKKNRILLVPNVHGPEGYWTKFDWQRALELGSKAAGLPYSGDFGFARTDMHWPLNHMVAPKGEALQCRDCHGPGGRIDFKALGYEKDPLAREEPQGHEPVVLRNADGKPVASDGGELSLRSTCGECHEFDDEDFVAAHSFHAGVKPEKLRPERRMLWDFGARPPAAKGAESNCLVCHLHEPAAYRWRIERAAGGGQSSLTVMLEDLGLVEHAQEPRWKTEKFGEEHEVELHIGPARDENCGICHGLVWLGREPLSLSRAGDATLTRDTGQVFAAQRISRSGLNVKGKSAMARPFDVHAERMFGCVECHTATSVPERLTRLENAKAEKVDRANGCLGCHSEGYISTRHASVKGWSAKSMSCEACHVPSMPGGKLELLDCTLPTADGSCRPKFKSVGRCGWPNASDYIAVPRPELAEEGGRRVPVSEYEVGFWYDGDKPVEMAVLVKAFYPGGKIAKELSRYDADGDGVLSDEEACTAANARDILERLLKAAGVKLPALKRQKRKVSIHHGVVPAGYTVGSPLKTDSVETAGR
ncbi:MAG: tetrathionate reductase family octaheme c-type cytochrome, partial [Deltaproteobacteria bacterium]